MEKQNKLINYEYPIPGELFKDIDGNILLVEEVDPKDRLGREVRGSLSMSKGTQYCYPFSTTLQMWAEIWRDRCPRQDPKKMKC